MKVEHINFGRQLTGNFTLSEPIQAHWEKQVVTLHEVYGSYMVSIPKHGPILIQAVDKDSELLLQEWKMYHKQAVAWIENSARTSILLTVAIFPNQFQFPASEPLSIAVNPAIERDIRGLNLNNQTLLSRLTADFFKNGVGFAILSSELEGGFRLIGNEFFCDVTLNRYQQFQVSRLLRRNHRSIHQPVTLLKGNLQFIDELDLKLLVKNQTQDAFSQEVNRSKDVLKLWEIYNELEKETRKEEVIELGWVKYSQCKYVARADRQDELIFTLEENDAQLFKSASIGFEVASDPFTVKNEELLYPRETIFIGTEYSLLSGGNKVMIKYEMDERNSVIPDKGYIMAAYNGSKTMIKRRETALVKIRQAETPLVTLGTLLQNGEANIIEARKRKAVNEKSRKQVFGTSDHFFTDKQYEAIEVAINTPDIAIIQGPPGTGKTSVIKAIVTKVQDDFNNQVRILISSYQHDAVDNAIVDLYSGGVPVNRIGGRKSQSELDKKRHVWNWVHDLQSKCDVVLRDTQEKSYRLIYRKVNELIEQYRAIAALDETSVLPILKEIYQKTVAILDATVHEQLKQLILEQDQKTSTTTNEVQTEPRKRNRLDERLLKLLESQRLESSLFLDDGPLQARRLLQFLKKYGSELSHHVEIPEELEEAVASTYDESASIEAFLMKFTLAIKKVQIQLDGESTETSTGDKETIQARETIDALLKTILESLAEKVKEQNGNLADLITQFKEDLEDHHGIDELLEKYTQIAAATCQQTVSSQHKSRNEPYDYVIIDEAARANPLDLLIPMSLGKKIILVGDQKQLPHMLEQEIVDKYVKKQGSNEIKEFLKETLFEKLFNQFAEKQNRLHGINRVVTLQDQYRMHPKISEFVSQSFYENKVQSGVTEEMKAHTLGFYENKPVAWIDLPAHLGMEQQSSKNSKYREVEVENLVHELKKVLETNEDYTIGVITFYKKQALQIQDKIELLPYEMKRRILVGSVDAFQGREFDVVFLTTVRSNHQEDMRRRVGFLESVNRLCVAFSRAKRLLVVIGDSQTIAKDQHDQPVIPAFYDFYKLCLEGGYYEQR